MAKKSKTWSPKSKLKLNRWQLFVVVLLVGVAGVITLKLTRASSYWANAASFYGCPLNGYGVPSQTLSYGSSSSGPCVKLLQASLNIDSGFLIKIDGSFGNITELGTILFQRSAGISPANGVVNSNTWAKLGTIYNQIVPNLKSGGTWKANSTLFGHCCTLLTSGQYRLDGKDVNLTVNEWFNGATTTHFVQYGPYQTLAVLPGQKGLDVCYDYAAYNLALTANQTTGYLSVYTDTAYNSPTDGTIRIGSVTHNVAFDKTIYVSWDNYSHLMRSHCTNFPMTVGVYPKMEFRLKVNGSYVSTGVSSDNGGMLDLYRTRVIAY